MLTRKSDQLKYLVRFSSQHFAKNVQANQKIHSILLLASLDFPTTLAKDLGLFHILLQGTSSNETELFS